MFERWWLAVLAALQRNRAANVDGHPYQVRASVTAWLLLARDANQSASCVARIAAGGLDKLERPALAAAGRSSVIAWYRGQRLWRLTTLYRHKIGYHGLNVLPASITERDIL